jgi:hypothetical protein
MRLDDLADGLDAAGDELAGASTTVTLVDPGSRAFGADAPGALGELGRALHLRLSAALTARSREAAAHGARFADAAQSMRRVAEGYHDAEDATRDRHDLDSL